jgi:iron complex transport system ATP-binding protein
MSELSARDLHVRLGDKTVLSGVDVRFSPGQVTAVIGPNGAGKSTLLTCLAGLRRPDKGVVHLGDAALAGLSPRRRAQRIGFLPQIPEVAWAIDVRTLVGLGRTPYIDAWGLSVADMAAVDNALRLANVTDLALRNVATLSGGERTRVLLARALAGDPAWLLADEPLTGLDPGHQLDAALLLRRLAEDGRGVIVTLHDLHMAMRVAHRIVVLAQGRIIADGPPETALTPDVLTAAYGIDVAQHAGRSGTIIEIVGRRG